VWNSTSGGGDGDAGDMSIVDNLTRDVGTLLYSAPEQLNNTEHSSKVWSVPGNSKVRSKVKLGYIIVRSKA